MKEEGRANPSHCIAQEEGNKNLCIYGEDVRQSGDKSWGIVIFENGRVREMTV